MREDKQPDAFTELLAACEELDDTLRVRTQIKMIDEISQLEESNQSEAVDTVLQPLPRLPADEAAAVLVSLFKPLHDASTRLTTRCLDAGILLFTRCSGSAKRAILHELPIDVDKLPQLLRDRYAPSLLACNLLLPVEHQD